MIHLTGVAFIGLTSAALFVYGLNMLYLSWRSFGLPVVPLAAVPRGGEPPVAVQLPIFNERYVAERIIDAAAALDWPRDRIEIQVLDDSDDDTVGIVARRVAHWQHRGIKITQVRRSDRTGYKAGALAHGMRCTRADILAVFDADFVPDPDFLRRLVGAFADPKVGFVQARWGHLNEGYSWITRLQALSIDFHFLVEQSVRSSRGFLTNFTGTAGLWRRQAIDGAGGWSSRTLTEDLDLSYRAQLAGWRPCYREEVVVPEELPVAVDAYRRQQSRWATGSFQCAFALTGPVLRSRLPAGVKWQALVHLYSYFVPVLMLAQVICYPLLLLSRGDHGPLGAEIRLPLAINLISLAPSIAFMIAQLRRGRRWWHGAPGLVCQVIGAGLSLTVGLALLRALRPGGEFKRTPKYRIERAGQEWRDASYTSSGDPAAAFELAFAIGAGAIAAAAAYRAEPLMAVYAGLIGAGFLYLAGASAFQALAVVTVRRLGRRSFDRLRAGLPGLLLLAGPAALLVAIAQGPAGFEDSYHHWLIAANLAATGRLHDPLFGMEDTWLPAYHVFAALILRATGLWQIGLLRFANVGLALATLALVNHLAGSVRRGRLAVLLLALNPIFLLTATSVVAEPLTVVTLLGAAAAALRRRSHLAAGLAVLACLSGTKAWLWLAGALAVAGADWLRRRRRLEWPRLAWAVPALAMVAVLQLALGPAGHSVARAAQEVSSATARGDLEPVAGLRLLNYAGYFLLASLPLVALAPFSVRALSREPDDRRSLRLVVLPSIVYLVATGLLVGAGLYTGSHRYYYLGLPALALAAAAGIDRFRLPVGFPVAAAAALLTVAYLPTIASFSGGDAGLIKAGRAAGSTPGALLTDSPVAAFYSRKPVERIFGSQGLPDNRVAALSWLRSRGVTAAVVEDIDYYRVNEVFPGLAAGVAVAPFQAVGGPADYAAPGGKRVVVYRLPPERFYASLGAGALVDIDPESQAQVGKTAGLEKGLALETADRHLIGEGLGFGVPLVRYPGADYLAGEAVTVDTSGPAGPAWTKTFILNRVGIDDDRRWVAAGSRGRIAVSYRVSGSRIEVQVRVLKLDPGYTEVVVMNEQSAEFNDYADPSQLRIGSQVGSWTPVAGGWARFRSGALGIEWSQPALPATRGFYAAREQRPPDLDFSGLEYVFGPGFTGADYTITVGPAR